MRCEVLVAGGGAAGLAAAVGAARAGAETLLVERHGSLGGMATASLVHSICGLFRLDGEWANTGFPREFAERLLALGAAPPVQMGRVKVLLTQPAAMARLGDLFTRELPKLTVRLHTELVAAAPDLRSVEISTRGRRETVPAKALVDATGDAALATLAGLASEQAAAARLQRPAIIFCLQGVDPAALQDAERLRLAGRLVAAVRAERLPAGALGATLRGSGRGGEAYVSIDLAGPEDYDPTDPACLTQLEQQGREIAWLVADFLRAEVAGFEKSFAAAFPARIGIRESRRIVGEYRLATADVEAGAQFEDAVAQAAWPMELRESATRPILRFPHDDRPCDIPLRSLRARGWPQFFMAGRCISCSHEAQASIRVIGTCLATGEAAGVAAALLAGGGECAAVDVRRWIEQNAGAPC